MDRKECEVLRLKPQATLDASPLPGVRVRLGSARFEHTSVTFKLEIAEVVADGLVMNEAATSFQQMAEFCGLKLDDLGKEITHNRERYKIIGAKWRGKFPVLVQRVADGKDFRFNIPAVQKALGREVTPERAL
jgi:hypothetical protein